MGTTDASPPAPKLKEYQIPYNGSVRDLFLVGAENWLREHPDATAREKRAYREAVNTVLIALRMYVLAEEVREELGKMFFPWYERRRKKP